MSDDPSRGVLLDIPCWIIRQQTFAVRPTLRCVHLGAVLS